MSKNYVIKKIDETNKTVKYIEHIDKLEDSQIERIEDVTKYGEFIPSYYNWITLEKQKMRTEHLSSITSENVEES